MDGDLARDGSAVVSMRGVRKAFGHREVLRGIDLDVAAHEVVALIGASGSGKSTLLRCINMLEPVDAGTISVLGTEITAAGADPDVVRRSVGIVFQAFNLFPHLKVLDNITLAPRKAKGENRADAEREATALLERFGLAPQARSYPDRLSGGQQQRVAIIRALAMRPQVLLLDEITSALDPVLVGEVLRLLRELAADGLTMILATHEMGFCRDVATRVCFLHEGRIVESGPPIEMLGSPREPETRAFLARVSESGRL
jgi:polar amino acid transport system ATP-binding protein